MATEREFAIQVKKNAELERAKINAFKGYQKLEDSHLPIQEIEEVTKD